MKRRESRSQPRPEKEARLPKWPQEGYSSCWKLRSAAIHGLEEGIKTFGNCQHKRAGVSRLSAGNEGVVDLEWEGGNAAVCVRASGGWEGGGCGGSAVATAEG